MQRNNEDRTSVLDAEPSFEPGPLPNTTASNLQSFPSPTEFVELPSKGEFYEENHPLHKKTHVEIRFMTAKDEDILSSKPLLKKGIAIDRFLQNVIIDKKININDMLTGDKNAIAIAARITGYGSEYLTKVVCPGCNETSEFQFDLQEASQMHFKEDNDQVVWHNNTFSVNLPRSKATVECKLLVGSDEKKLTHLFDIKKKNNLIESTVTDQIKLMIISVNGNTNVGYINSFVDNAMPAMDSKYLREVYAKVMPNVQLKQQFVCRNCDLEVDMEVPLTTDFFWPR